MILGHPVMTDTKFYAIVEFEDGLQIVPYNWLNEDSKKAVWPNFTNNKRYDKAVKLMEEPEPTWLTHNIRKVYGTYSNYGVARQKLKQAEEESDLTSTTEKEEYLKKSRKIRAAKVVDTSTSSSDELSDEFIREFSKIPKIDNVATCRNKSKTQKNPQKDINYRNINRKCAKKIENKVDNNRTINRTLINNQCIVEIGEKDDFQLQEDENIELCDGELNVMTVYDCNYNVQESQYTENVSNPKECYDKDDVNSTLLAINTSGSKLNYKKKPQCIENLPNPEECYNDEDNINDDVNSMLSTNNMPNVNYEQRMENFQRFVVRKLINLELKVNNVKSCQQALLDKLSLTSIFEMEQREIDIFEDLPLKDENSLQLMETKLKNDLSYRNQMIKQLVRLTCDNMKTSCLRVIKSILSNNLAEKYSWYGAKKKQNFSKLDICKIIMNVIRKSHTNVTDEQIAAPIKIWLAHAKERMERSRNIQE
ncbi:uncharacterized protein [Polyergus mexicanus]|uniref:uncharacterized protein n=1 Tax=Polyergus mexicanus TaxID=615972 RepID=UPI0038B5AC55